MSWLGLIIILFSIGSPHAADICEEHYAAVLKIRASLDYQKPDAASNYIALLQTTRDCFGDVKPDTVFWLYQEEIHVLRLLNDHEEALHRLDELSDRFPVIPDTANILRVFSMRGNVNYYLNHLMEAVRNYTQAIPYCIAETAQNAFPCVKLYLDYGNVLQRLRDFSSAKNHYLRADRRLQDLDSTHTDWRPMRIRSLNVQADLLIAQAAEYRAGAEDSVRKAITLLNHSQRLQRGRPADEETVRSFMLRGDAYIALGNLYDVEGLYRQSLDIARGLEDPYLVFRATHLLGRLYTKTGVFGKAETFLLDAFARIDAARHIDYKRRLVNDIGYLYERWAKPTEATIYYQQAIAFTEQYHESLRLTDWSAMALSAWREPFRGQARVHFMQAQMEDAFKVLEGTRARHLQDLLTHAVLLGTLPTEDRHRYDSLSTRLDVVLSRLSDERRSAEERIALEVEQSHIIAERRALLKLGAPFSPPPIEDLQRHLRQSGQAVLSYFIDTEDLYPHRPARSYCFVLTQDTMMAVPLQVSESAVLALLEQVSPLLTQPDASPGMPARIYGLRPLHQLYELLFAPVAPYVQQHDRLVIIPDGPLFMLPFAALVQNDVEEGRLAEASFLVDNHAIAYELATALLLREEAPPAEATYDLVAFGKADFADYASGDHPVPALGRGVLNNLDAVPRELAAISKGFRKSLKRIDAEATEAAFFALSDSIMILHMASHTLLQPSLPMDNAIVLSRDEPDDGLLYLYEIRQHFLAAQLVVLSGCNTARGRLQSGEGMAGLQYAFRAIGVPSTLATSWYVDDNTMARLMEFFYQNLLQGDLKDEALQKAQRALLASAEGQRRSPFFWAAPVLFGSAAALPLQRRDPPDTLGLVLALLAGLTLLLALLYLRRRARRRTAFAQ